VKMNNKERCKRRFFYA